MRPSQAILRPAPAPPYVSTLYGVEVLAYCARVLWQARNTLGLSRRDVGLQLGLNRNTIRSFELAEYWLAMPKVLHYAQIVQVPYVDLFPCDPDAPTPVYLTAIEAKILQHLRYSPPGKAEALLDVLEYPPPALPCPLHTVVQP